MLIPTLLAKRGRSSRFCIGVNLSIKLVMYNQNLWRHQPETATGHSLLINSILGAIKRVVYRKKGDYRKR
jgi:hypothetical protein